MTSLPAQLTRTVDLMSGYRSAWFLCGGWAVDAWLGHQTRHHLDVDIAVFQRDQHVLFDHLTGWHLVGHDPNVADDTTERWNGRHLDLPAHIHANIDAMGGTELDIQLNEFANGHWICNQEPLINHRLDNARQPAWDLPTAPPELVLFYKAGGNLAQGQLDQLRPHDKQDFLALVPTLTTSQLTWLRDAITLSHPNHAWLAHLTR